MSVLLVLFAAQATELRVQKESFVTRMAWPEVTAEMVPFVRTYFDCLNPSHLTIPARADGKASEWMARQRVAGCAETRRWAISRSIESYKPVRGGETNAAKFVNNAFDQMDRDQLIQAQYVDKVIAGAIELPEDHSKPIDPKSEATTPEGKATPK